MVIGGQELLRCHGEAIATKDIARCGHAGAGKAGREVVASRPPSSPVHPFFSKVEEDELSSDMQVKDQFCLIHIFEVY